MNTEWKMPEWMIKWVHVIDTSKVGEPTVEFIEWSMNEPGDSYNVKIKAKVELMETLHKKGII